MDMTFGTMVSAIRIVARLSGLFCLSFLSKIVLINLLLFILSITLEGQQVIVNYIIEEKPISQYATNGRQLDFPEQNIKATLKATPKASIWSQDSMMFKRAGVFADGFQLYVPGLWEFRNKITKKRLSHRLYFGTSEFVESNIDESLFGECSQWVIQPIQTKSILGIQCTKAIRKCGDKDQFIYFTHSIPIADGPVYFSSIPGLVMEFDDGRYHYIAQHITANENELTPPKTVNSIRENNYSASDSRVVINKHNIAANKWVNLNQYYLIY